MDPLSMMLGIGSLGAGLFGQSQTNQMQAQMMQQQQSFQQQMSSTAYQRASADMKAAGLNPMMMFGSGAAASSPSGAPVSPNIRSGLDADSMQKAISSATQAKVANATIDNLVEQNAKIKAEAATEKVRPGLVLAQTAHGMEQAVTERGRQDVIRENIPIIHNEAIRALNQAGMNHTARRLLDIGAYGGEAASKTLRPITDALHSAANVKRLLSPY